MRVRETASALAAGVVMTFSTPAGNPASLSSSARKKPALIGASSVAFRTTVFPTASGIPTARALRYVGAFHGEKAATTPAGRRIVRDRAPGSLVAFTSPTGAVAAAAASRIMPSARWTMNMPQPKVAPVSGVIAAMTSLVRSFTSWAARRKTARRSAGDACDQVLNAAAAASTARVASAGLAAATVAIASPVYGLMSS